MRAHACLALAAALLLPACKQGDPAPLEELPAAEHCSVEDSLVAPALTSAQLGRVVGGAFQPLTNGGELEVMPFSYESYLNVPFFVAPVAIRVVPPANVTETSLCGATGLVSDAFSNHVFHRVDAYLVAEGVLLPASYGEVPSGSQAVLSADVFFPLADRTFRARSPDLLVTYVDREGIRLSP